jgi:hypothetical protein
MRPSVVESSILFRNLPAKIKASAKGLYAGISTLATSHISR